MDLAPLTISQGKIFYRAVHLLSDASKNKKVLTTFRGDSYASLADRVGCESGWDGVIYQRTFYFGAKSKHFLENNKTVAKRRHLNSIEDVSEATFEFLFKKIAKICHADAYKGHPFWDANRDIVELFTNPENRAYFLSRVNAASEEMKVLVRDYYLYLLHTAGRKGVADESMLVSTSTQWLQAEAFVSRLNAGKIIYYYFVPAPFERYCITSQISTHAFDLIRYLSLPVYAFNSGLYPKQREVSIRGGLLPHFMLGILRVDLNEFVVNPHLLAMPEEDLDSILVSGIKIDQSDFNDRIKETLYQRYAELDGDRFAAFMIQQ